MYTFYLGEIRLPIAPSKVVINMGSLNKTLTLVEGKEINILKSPRLRTIEFDALIPNCEYPFANYGGEYKSSEYYKEAIEKLKNENSVITFIISRKADGKMFNYTGIYAVIEDIKYIESAENGYDLIMSIKLREYEKYGAKFYTAEKSVTAPAAVKSAGNKSYTIKSGDSLWKIAKKIYGDGSKWKSIYQANKNVITNPDKIRTGTSITLP